MRPQAEIYLSLILLVTIPSLPQSVSSEKKNPFPAERHHYHSLTNEGSLSESARVLSPRDKLPAHLSPSSSSSSSSVVAFEERVLAPLSPSLLPTSSSSSAVTYLKSIKSQSAPPPHRLRKHGRSLKLTNPPQFEDQIHPSHITNTSYPSFVLTEVLDEEEEEEEEEARAMERKIGNPARHHRDVSERGGGVAFVPTTGVTYSRDAPNGSTLTSKLGAAASPSAVPTSLLVLEPPGTERPEADDEQPEEELIPWADSFLPGATCRFNEDMNPLKFQLETCAMCYVYMPPHLFYPKKKFVLAHTHVLDSRGLRTRVFGLGPVVPPGMNRTIVIANISDPASPIYDTFEIKDAVKKWEDCCEAAMKCCKKIQKLPDQSNMSNPLITCPKTWDGWQCWEEAEGEVTVENTCPDYIYFLIDKPSCHTFVYKECWANGSWYVTSKGREWSNYTKCVSNVQNMHKKRAHVHVMAYTVSIIALIPALIVFFAYRQLRVHRIILHQNLFISFLLNGLLIIALKTFIILHDLNAEHVDRTAEQNPVWCRLLLIMTKYSRLTNYMWMFCEGYYLHKLIAAAFAEQESLLVFYLIGWVFPIIPTAIYAGLRLYDANVKCWVVPEETYEWVVNLPSLLSLVANLCFIIHIIYVLVMKLRAQHANEPSQYRKAVRATLVLLPLFGLHFLLTIYRPPASAGTCEWIELYNYVDYVLDGLQGFLVALNFCYVNGEVTALLKRTYSRWREQHATAASICQRQITRLNTNRNNNRGRSVVSTHYSSVPASPELSRSLTRLTIPNNEIQGAQVGSAPISDKTSAEPLEDGKNNKLVLTNGKPSNHSLLVTNCNDDESGGSWTEIKLGVGGDPSENDSLEMKQAFTLNPNSPIVPASALARNSTTNSRNNNNGVVGEHQL